MVNMNLFHYLAIFSLLVIFSFFIERLSAKSRIPSVFFLLVSGMFLRLAADRLGISIQGLDFTLQALGIVGLVFIVLEGALDLELSRERMPMVARATLSAVLVLGLTAFCLAGIYRAWLDLPWTTCLLNAVPLAVISSAVAIPSARRLPEDRREFLIYEATLSDILGILAFNFLLAHQVIDRGAFGSLGFDILLTLGVSAGAILALAWIVAKVRDTSKFTLLFALLVLAISVGKIIHLPTLLLVFILGLAMNNPALFLGRFGFSMGKLSRLKVELRFLRRLTSEGSFALRTFFFIVFGFSITMGDLASWKALALGTGILILLFLVRAGYFAAVERRRFFPEAFLAPRGLITVLLFFTIPSDRLIPGIGRDVVCIVILGSTFVLAGAHVWFGIRSREATGSADADELIAASAEAPMQADGVVP
jgi:Kef-type K+ transport system membrane component KefB